MNKLFADKVTHSLMLCLKMLHFFEVIVPEGTISTDTVTRKLNGIMVVAILNRFTLKTVSAIDRYLECEQQELLFSSALEFFFVIMGSCRHQRSRSAIKEHLSAHLDLRYSQINLVYLCERWLTWCTRSASAERPNSDSDNDDNDN